MVEIVIVCITHITEINFTEIKFNIVINTYNYQPIKYKSF